MKPIALLLVGSGLLLASCSKKTTDPTPPAVDKPALLTAHDWRITGYTMELRGQTSDMYSLMTCGGDDYYHFDANGTWRYDDGTVKCSPTSPQTRYSGTWRYDARQDYLFMTGMPFIMNNSRTREDYLDPFTVSATELKIVFNWNDNGAQTKETLTMVPR
jgi:hypothetical protein